MIRLDPSSVAAGLGRWLAASAAVGLVALPVVAEQAVEAVSFEDSLGTLPVRVSLCHQGRSTLETGVLGDLHYERTGAFGFGVRARVTEPPRAGGTLASYVDPRFVRANVQFIDDPDAAVASYASEFGSRLLDRVGLVTGVTGLAGGLVVVLLLGGRSAAQGHRRARLAVLVAGSLAASTGAAAVLLERWPCNGDPDPTHPFPAVPGLSFSSPQTLEVARQVRPFLEKNRERIAEQTEGYVAAAEDSFASSLGRRADTLLPGTGEVVVVAEADPQGSYVGTRVRTRLLERLVTALGEDAVALRTVSGDVTSNGTVAEEKFVEAEAAVGGDLPVAAVGGDHDSEATPEQMAEHGMAVPDLTTVEVGGLRVSGAHDVEHKALFGTLVRNDSGLTEAELGARLREEVDPEQAGIVLLHQPDAVAGYLGVDDLDDVRGLTGSRRVPYDDGVPDVPPGTVTVGHLHDLDGPWVLWNTDGEQVTWTVVDQLGTSGGVEERPTFSRFSTPVSLPLKDLTLRLQYVDVESGLQTGWATVVCDTSGRCEVSGRTDVGLPLPDAPSATDRGGITG
ncbi:MAG: hypothetical protein AVDCRST_MAG36-599 [uncultured Nocardioidaceae bacterium]|uniref:Calcineurin-like phosphoesterase domain-containing protein n=1 Tax=uncultured Nocardioidaceae bacterium TaxID=253824 RepID=A0A6J4L2M0_9ACTN|nr:MAG: hypothetical protein AVDCRST_MAG36-599 [uncultured Nocardioidaceae bacterium]